VEDFRSFQGGRLFSLGHLMHPFDFCFVETADLFIKKSENIMDNTVNYHGPKEKLTVFFLGGCPDYFMIADPEMFWRRLVSEYFGEKTETFDNSFGISPFEGSNPVV